MTHSSASAQTGETVGVDPFDRLARGAIPVAVLLIPAASLVIAVDVSPAVSLLPYALLAIAGVASARRFHLERNPAQIAAWLLPLLMLIALAAAPGGYGSLLVAAAGCGAGMVVATSSWSETDLTKRVALPLLATSAVQTVLIIAQTLTDEAVGLNWLVPGAELSYIDGLLRSQGTMTHVYEPAALALLAAGVAVAVRPQSTRLQRVWLIGTGLAGVTVGLTHSRSALFGLLLMAVFIGIAAKRGDRHSRNVGGALLVGFVIAALFTGSAWAHRGDHTTTGGLDDASLGRVTLAKQAIRMALDHPVLGVGPGQYMDTMRAEYELDDRYPLIVHNVPLAIAAESGIPTAIVITFLIGWAMIRAVRSGPRGGALAVSLSGFLLFDVLHYDRGVGLLMLGVWLAVLQHYDAQSRTSRTVRSE